MTINHDYVDRALGAVCAITMAAAMAALFWWLDGELKFIHGLIVGWFGTDVYLGHKWEKPDVAQCK